MLLLITGDLPLYLRQPCGCSVTETAHVCECSNLPATVLVAFSAPGACYECPLVACLLQTGAEVPWEETSAIFMSVCISWALDRRALR